MSNRLRDHGEAPEHGCPMTNIHFIIECIRNLFEESERIREAAFSQLRGS